MRAILTLVALSIGAAWTPDVPRRYVVVPTNVPADAGGPPCPPSLSADGESVAFEAHVSLDPADQNGRPDVYLLERSANRPTLVSRNLVGRAGRGSSRCPRISGDGQRVVFESDATDLVEGGLPGTAQVFVFDSIKGAVRRITPMIGGEPTMSARPALSADGRVVVFEAWPVDATHDQRHRVYRTSLGTQNGFEDLGDGHSAAVSADGSVVAFVTSQYLGAPQSIRVVGPDSRRTVGSPGGEMDVAAPALSADGQWITYVSRHRSSRTGIADVARAQVYVERLGDGLRRLVSATPQGREANGYSKLPAIDATGNRVVFESNATDIGCNPRSSTSCDTDINLLGDVFIWDRTAGSVARVNVVTSELLWLEGAGYPTVSPDGTSIAFLSRQPVSHADGRDTFDLFITRAVNGDAFVPSSTRGGGR